MGGFSADILLIALSILVHVQHICIEKQSQAVLYIVWN